MNGLKPYVGQAFPHIQTPKLGGGHVAPSKPGDSYDWRLLVVYRGKHCPLCTNYLKTLSELVPQFNALGVEVCAVSADSEEKAEEQMKDVNPTFDIGYDLSVEQMSALGLYISSPKLGMGAERPFAEPGLFVINEENNLQLTDISNAPFARPDLQSILNGIKFIRNLTESFPVNGTFQS